LRETTSYEPSCVKISSVVFPVQDGKKREGKEREGKAQKVKRYISPIRGEAPCKRISTKFCTSGDMLDVIICANFGVKKLRGLENTRGQILEFTIEMDGQPYNSAALPRTLPVGRSAGLHFTHAPNMLKIYTLIKCLSPKLIHSSVFV